MQGAFGRFMRDGCVASLTAAALLPLGCLAAEAQMRGVPGNGAGGSYGGGSYGGGGYGSGGYRGGPMIGLPGMIGVIPRLDPASATAGGRGRRRRSATQAAHPRARV